MKQMCYKDHQKLSGDFGGYLCLAHRLSINPSSLLSKLLRLNWSRANARHLNPTFSEHNWLCSCTKNRIWKMPLLPCGWANLSCGCASGASGGLWRASLWKIKKVAVASPFFPPLEQATVKAIACELPRQHKQPLSRYALSDLVRRVEQEPTIRPMSRSTIWRILQSAAIKPWQHRCWIFPHDPLFIDKATVVLDLYAGFWEGRPLRPNDYIISADEKTSIQARIRLAETLAPAPRLVMRYEHEYERGGALQYLAAWDVRRGLPMGLCAPKTGIEPFHQLVDLIMRQEPYRSARRVFWIVDGGSSHHGEAFANRLRGWYANANAVPLPVHASWLNQIEIYFSIVQRKVLTPNDFIGLQEVEQQLMEFESYFAQVSKPFDWRFTSKDLELWYNKLQGWEELRLAA
jgi:DDE superfamily endonuclease